MNVSQVTLTNATYDLIDQVAELNAKELYEDAFTTQLFLLDLIADQVLFWVESSSSTSQDIDYIDNVIDQYIDEAKYWHGTPEHHYVRNTVLDRLDLSEYIESDYS